MPYSPWQMVAEFDFSAQANLDIFAGGSGAYVIGGLTWTARNIANSTEFQIINGTGLRITQPAGTNRTITNASNTGPQIGVQLGALYPAFDPTLDYALQGVVNYLDPPDVAGPTTLIGNFGPSGSPSGGAGQRFVGVGRGNTDLVVRIDENGSSIGTTANGATNNLIAIVNRGSGESIALAGQVSTGFMSPSVMLNCAIRTNQFNNTFSAFIQRTNEFLIATVTRTTLGTSFQVVVPRISLWAR